MLPEVSALHRASSIVRIPPSQDVPMSDRVRRILDSSPLRRLASISQLGMVALVYPGATHSRLEHTLGVYHNALKLLARFSSDHAENLCFTVAEAEAFLLATILHDVGHWPFCHPIEDMRLSDLGEHETRLAEFIETSELKQLIESDWTCTAKDIVTLLDYDPKQPHSPGTQFFSSCLSSPIDVDKLDYLQRDSLHAGVPYGQNFDAGRLINSMCRHPETGKLAISEKGRTAAEMMVFARYVMFSEVYWHPSVRSATAMLQRSVYHLQKEIDLPSTLKMDDRDWIAMLRRNAMDTRFETMVEGLFGARRELFKRVAEYSVLQSGSQIHDSLSRRPYWWLVAASEKLACRVSRETGISVHPADVLIDAPPVKLEVDINIDVIGRDGSIRSLGEVSPVASALAHRQFDNHVKRVRVFVRANLRDALFEAMKTSVWDQLLMETTDEMEKETA
jgi:HD superfamily phosphohydrolase